MIKKKAFVDSLIGVLRCMDPARKSCLFSVIVNFVVRQKLISHLVSCAHFRQQLVRLKEQSAKVLSPKYFSDRHQGNQTTKHTSSSIKLKIHCRYV